jgi:hypothetical protein
MARSRFHAFAVSTAVASLSLQGAQSSKGKEQTERGAGQTYRLAARTLSRQRSGVEQRSWVSHVCLLLCACDCTEVLDTFLLGCGALRNQQSRGQAPEADRTKSVAAGTRTAQASTQDVEQLAVCKCLPTMTAALCVGCGAAVLCSGRRFG